MSTSIANPPRPNPTLARFGRRVPLTTAAAAGCVLAGALVLSGGYFTVPQNAVASVTRFGALHDGPLDPGLHFKLPLIDKAYTLQTSWQNRKIEAITAKTVDNQTVTLVGVNITFRFPKENANQALFRVGEMGTGGIADNFIPVVMDRTLRVLGHYNTLDVNPRKDQISTEIMAVVAPDVRAAFGVEIGSIQIPEIRYDPVFEQSVANAVAAKNQAIQAEAELRRIQIQAQQAEATARGVAAAQIAQAEAAARQQGLQADAAAHAMDVQTAAQARATAILAAANAEATRLAGEAAASALRAKVAAMGGADPYIRSVAADALGRWNGSVPGTVLGDKGPQLYMPIMPEPPAAR